MTYKIKTDKKVEYYEVEYDLEKLKEIKEKLEDYSYTLYAKGNMKGLFIYRCNNRNYVKRCKEYFETVYGNYKDSKLYNIKFDSDEPSIEFEYSYTKLPDLYYYIDIIINKKSVRSFPKLFESDKLQRIAFNIDEFKLVMDELFSYINSYELVDNDPMNKFDNNYKYDYKGLNELYKETLNSFTFKLIARKEFLDTNEIVSGYSLQLKKQKSN